MTFGGKLIQDLLMFRWVMNLESWPGGMSSSKDFFQFFLLCYKRKIGQRQLLYSGPSHPNSLSIELILFSNFCWNIVQYNDIVIGKFGSPRVYELVLNTIFARRGKCQLWSALSSFLLGLNYFQLLFLGAFSPRSWLLGWAILYLGRTKENNFGSDA